MTITVRDIAEKMELFAPFQLCEKWDNVGLLVGSYGAKVERVLIALDMDSATVNEGIDAGVDLIITHHPIMLKPLNKITDDTVEGSLIQSLIKHNISMFAAHTNLDTADGGVNDSLARCLKLANVQKLNMNEFEGSARMGSVKPITLAEFAESVKYSLSSAVMKCTGDKGTTIKKVAVCSGSGSFMLKAAKINGCDVLVTGEAKYNDEQLAYELGICLIEAGHYETETIICDVLCDYLHRSFNDIKVMVSKRDRTYYE